MIRDIYMCTVTLVRTIVKESSQSTVLKIWHMILNLYECRWQKSMSPTSVTKYLSSCHYKHNDSNDEGVVHDSDENLVSTNGN